MGKSACLLILTEVKFVIHLLRWPECLWMCWFLREQTQLSMRVLSHGSGKQRRFCFCNFSVWKIKFCICFTAWITLSVCILVQMYQMIQCPIFIYLMFHTIIFSFCKCFATQLYKHGWKVLHVYLSPSSGWYIFIYFCFSTSVYHTGNWKPVKVYCPTFWLLLFFYLCFAVVVVADLALCNHQ